MKSHNITQVIEKLVVTGSNLSRMGDFFFKGYSRFTIAKFKLICHKK